MTQTEELRHLLDERGVEWEAFDDFEQTTQWSTHNGAFVYWARERDGKLFVETTAPTKCSASFTSEQVIAATVGVDSNAGLEEENAKLREALRVAYELARDYKEAGYMMGMAGLYELADRMRELGVVTE